MDFKSKYIFNRQKVLFFAIFSLTVFLAVIAFCVFVPNKKRSLPAHQTLDLPGDRGVSPQEILISQLDSRNRVLSKNVEFLEKTVIEIKKNEEERLKKDINAQKEIESMIKPN